MCVAKITEFVLVDRFLLKQVIIQHVYVEGISNRIGFTTIRNTHVFTIDIIRCGLTEWTVIHDKDITGVKQCIFH